MSVIEMDTGSVGESALAMEEPDEVTKTIESKKYKTQQKNRISNNILFFNFKILFIFSIGFQYFNILIIVDFFT